MIDQHYDAVVYDLDGTLVRLDVDWAAVTRAVEEVFLAAGVDTDERSLWDFLVIAEDHGLGEEVEATIESYERLGAESSRRLPLADRVNEHSIPVGVCSLNAESAVRIALRTHDIDSPVSAVVGRDTVEGHKPNPEPLLTVIERLDASPDRSLFVGDSKRDKTTAERAGTSYRDVEDLLL